MLVIKPPNKGFAPLGEQFPSDGLSVEGAQANIAYVLQELRRWRVSFVIMHDGSSKWMHFGVYAPTSFEHALECMKKSLTSENRGAIEEALRKALPPLKPWVGAIVRTSFEYSDWQRAFNETLFVLWNTVIELDLFVDVPEGYRREAEICQRSAENQIGFQASLARIDRIDYVEENPWGWFKYMARNRPGQLVGKAINRVLVAPAKKLFGRKPAAAEVPDRFKESPDLAKLADAVRV